MKQTPSLGPSIRRQRCELRLSAARTSVSTGRIWPRRSKIWPSRSDEDCGARSRASSQHQVKLEYSPAIEPRNGWRRTIRLARLDIARILEDSPSLKREIPRLIEKETAGAVQLAILDLEDHGEIDQMELPTIKNTTYTEEQVLGEWFPAEPVSSAA